MPEFDADYFNSPAFQRGIAAAVEQYSPAPVEPVYYAPEPVYYAPEPVAGIGRGGEYDYYQPGIGYIPEEVYTPEPMRTPAVEPMTVEAAPIMGIGSPAVAEADLAPSLIETAAAADVGTGTQVVNNATYQPSDAELEAMTLTRDQWNDAMASFATMDLSNLNFGGFGTNFGISNPDYANNYRVFTAPKSNKGNPTSTVSKKDNTFTLIENQPIRLVDQRTGKVVFQGTGYEAAEKAIELAAGLTKAGGNKADWEIQTGQFKNPGSGDLVFGDDFKIVANEKKNTSILNKALDIVGDAALGFIIGGPIGAAIAAGASAAGVNVSDIAYPIIATAVLGPVGFAGTAGAVALGSAVSSVVQGRSIEETLIRATVAGVTAGVVTGTDVGGTISDAVGGVLKDIGFESQVSNIISGIGGSGTVDAVTGDIIVNAATNAATSAVTSGAVGSAVSSAIVDAVKTIVPDYSPSSETKDLLNNVDNTATAAADNAATAGGDIVVNGSVTTGSLTGANPIVGAVVGSTVVPVGDSAVNTVVDGVDTATGEIVAEAPRVDTTATDVGTIAGIGNGAVNTVVDGVDQVTGEIVAEAPKTDTTATDTATVAGIGSGAVNTVIDGVDQVTGEIVAEGARTDTTATDAATTAGAVNTVVDGIDTATGEIVVDANTDGTVTDNDGVLTVTTDPGIGTGSVTDSLGPPDVKSDPNLTDDDSVLDTIRDVADVAGTVLPIVAGGGGGGGGGTIGPDTSKINFTKSTLRPTLTGNGIGGTGGRYPYTPQTYGRAGGDQETEFLFFTKDPVTGQETVQAAPITTPIANEPAGPAMILPSGNEFAEGGEVDDDMVKHLVEYHKNGGHQGPGQVKGIGSGQEDKIPAWLSDGEYVWSAQDVSDLGDGSNKEGVRRLDKMRQMVRRQAGRKDVKKIAKPQKGIDTMLKAVGGLV
jgi:hypothetical protein